MTDVHFYHNVSDTLALTCKLVSRAHSNGRKAVVICSDSDQAQKLDQLLWTSEPSSFIPHVMSHSPLEAHTPIIIGLSGEKSWPHTDLLFNLAAELPIECERFRIVMEIVSHNEAERVPARARWGYYKQQQFPLKAIDAALRTVQ